MVTVHSARFNAVPAGRSCVVEHLRSPIWGYNLHAHPSYELMLIQNGESHALVGDHRDWFATGDCYLLAPEVVHSFHSDGFLPNGRVIDALVLSFSPELVDAQRIPELAALAPLLSRARRGIRFRKFPCEDIAADLRDLHAGAGGALAIALVYRVLHRLVGALPGETLSSHDDPEPHRNDDLARIEAVRGIIRRRFREPVTPEQVAREAGMSPTTLNLLLHKYERTTFLRLLTRARLDEARRLLVETDDDVTEIAFGAGFGSLSTFNRRFRAELKRSPQEYRSGKAAGG